MFTLGSGKAKCEYLDRKLVLSNDYLSLDIFIDGGVNPANLLSKKTGKVYSDSRYRYRCQVWEREGKIPKYVAHSEKRRSTSHVDSGNVITIIGKIGDLEIEQSFFVPDYKPYLEERITLRNTGKEPLNTSGISFGFTKVLGDKEGLLLKDLENCQMVAVPYRRECWFGRNGEYVEYSFQDLLSQQGWYRPWFKQEEKIASEKFGSEGWAWTGEEPSLLIAKHNLEGMEFSLLEIGEENGKPVLQFGGCGVWHGDPEHATKIDAGKEFHFGLTRYAFVEGGWKECYYAFRDFMNEQGHGIPANYNPPIHWNELYDNPFWWEATKDFTKETPIINDRVELRQRLYTLESMKEEAKKAKELGCEALYLDPGWDTMFGSSIWAAERLLSAEQFVEMMKTEYGLDVSLHTPLAGWSDYMGHNATYPEKAHKKVPQDFKGDDVTVDLCMASPEYIKTKTERLLELAKAGVVFFMFDGDGYWGPCYDSAHGHSVPLSREEHGKAILKLAQNVHEEFPNVLIELHAFLGSCVYPCMPTYYLHEPGGPDEFWAFEYMIDPMWDLLSGRAVSLYYYNLAYGYPLYIHIDLRKDNESALEFWWYASTCRHLGVGGKHPDPKVWEAHKLAMKKYRRLKRFYTQGKFYGLDETVHAHTLEDEGAAVVNVFNLTDEKKTKEVTFDLQEIGLEPQRKIDVKGASYDQKGSKVTLRFELSGKSTALAEISSVQK